MLYIYLRKKVKAVMASDHPHLKLQKAYKTTQFQGSGRWVAVGLRPGKKSLRYAYGNTAREAYLTYVAIFLGDVK